MTSDDSDRGNLRNLWNLWQVVGRLEANVERLLDGQSQLKAELKETNDRIDRKVDRLDRKFDRMLYAVIAIGGTIIGLLITEIIRSG